MKNNKEQKKVRKPLKDLTLLDRFLFDTAMSDPEISRNILSIIFDDREIPPIHFSAAEQTQEPYFDSRAVRLDVLAIDEEGTVYDAEAQKEKKENAFFFAEAACTSHLLMSIFYSPGTGILGR